MKKSILFSMLLTTLLLAQTQINVNSAAQQIPDMYDTKVVWSDQRDGGYNIYMHDTDSNTETQITSNSDYDWHPKIYGDKIVYLSGGSDIYMYNITSGTQSEITTNPYRQSDPDIYGSKVVWEDDRNGYTNIYLYDISTGQETRITDHASNQSKPEIYGNKIVYMDDRRARFTYNIYVYDLGTGVETEIPADEVSQLNPNIYDDKIVWGETRDGNTDVYMYNLTTGIKTRITSDPAIQDQPTIYGNKIVYRDNRNGHWNIYMYDLSTNKESRVTFTDDSGHNLPAIYGEKVVYINIHSNGTGINMSDLTAIPQTYDKRDFAKRLYTTLLGRAYDEAGLDYYVDELDEGKSALEVAKSFFFSAEFQDANLSTDDFLTRLYQTFLDRDPDQDGLTYWSDQINNKGKTRRLVFYEFAFSPEFQELCTKYDITPSNSNDKLIGFIERLYVLVMGRESDGGGMDYWVEKLTTNEKSASDIVKDYYNAPEFTGKNLTNSQFISNAYSAVMGREADTGGLNYWIDKMNNEGFTRDDILEQFINSTEFANLSNEYGI